MHDDNHDHNHNQGHQDDHVHPHVASNGHTHGPVGEAAAPPTRPSQAVMLDVGAHAGALVLRSTAQRAGIEVEIHLDGAPERRQHVWVLPREGRGGSTVYAAVFASLAPGRYTVLETDGTECCTVSVPANQVTYAQWGDIPATSAMQPVGAA
jgi:ABC-type Zn2+ transport system substrate-binding protein/surface adhesin